ncbi:MAG: SIR2 family NAD-dependent protein deacylase [Dehalococcoidia bacterium]
MSTAIEETIRLIGAASRVMALTGAGISTESGIPDFRGPNGVWTRDPEAEKRATIQYYLAHREARVANWKARLDSPLLSAAPNAGHRALAELHRIGKLRFLVTQNVDGLHQQGGFPEEGIVEIHGTVHKFQCTNCTDRGPIERVLARVHAGEEDPPCRSCGGILKSATISFGQGLIPEDLYRSQAEAEQCDLFLAIGTTLAVYPAAELPAIAMRNGAKLVIMNAQETPYDGHASAIVRDQLGVALPQIVTRVTQSDNS